MTQGVSNHLAQASVRIEIGGRPNGSGFFIAPAFVVTCAHVLDEYLDTSASARTNVELVDNRGVKHQIAGTPRIARDADLALLQISAADPTVAATYLDENFEVNDRLQSFGFPENKPDGEPTTFDVEGSTGEPTPHIKLKNGQVRPGTSGSPLLNLRTGAVCAIVRRTRNERTDLGGYGIGVSTLFSTFQDVRKLNASAMKADQRWITSLTHEQRRWINASVDLVDDVPYIEFVIEVDQQEDRWLVRGKAEPEARATEAIIDLNTVRSEVPRLFRAWKAQGRIDDAEQSRLIGHVLFRAIAPAGIGGAIDRLVFQDKRPVHVSLCFTDEMDTDLVHLPWEQLYARAGSMRSSLGTTPQATLTRVWESEPDPAPPPPPGRSTLLMVSAPSDGHNDVADTTGKIVATINDIRHIEQQDVARELSLDKLEKLVRNTHPRVLHYVGYGRFQASRDEIVLAGDVPGYGPDFIDAEEFAQAVRPRPPQLVVLQTFAMDKGTVPVDPTSFAMTLLASGVQAVIAFPYPLTVDVAASAASQLYRLLDVGAPLRVAVQDVRRYLRTAHWSRPALFLRRPSDLALVSADGGG